MSDKQMASTHLHSRRDSNLTRAQMTALCALAGADRPRSAREAAIGYHTGPVIAALRWLQRNGFANPGIAHLNGTHRPEPVYWLTNDGCQLHKRLMTPRNAVGRCVQF